MPSKHEDRLKQLVAEVFEEFRRTINIIIFWDNGPEVSKLRGRLSDSILMTGIDELIEKSEKLVTEITALAQKRHRDIVR